jgi:hypothetical protein
MINTKEINTLRGLLTEDRQKSKAAYMIFGR